MASEYDKPHLSFDNQLDLLIGRGLECQDRQTAVDALRRIGYYRFSAYVYSFRELLPPGERGIQSPSHYRSEHLFPGTTFEQVLALWQFDRELRLITLDAMETIEVALRTQLAYVLGERDPFGHLRVESLGPNAAKRPPDESLTRHQAWLDRHRRDIEDKKSEDFLKHNRAKCEELPIWVAVETMDFGRAVRLFQILRHDDRTRIAAQFSVQDASLFESWAKVINYVRNACAHHSRFWNRTLTYSLRKMDHSQVNEMLHHLCGPVPTKKVYSALAVSAYLVKAVEPSSTWPRRLREHVAQMNWTHPLGPASDMGFPPGWESLHIWS
jgi:abortive infection bacteriophage resistance protein